MTVRQTRILFGVFFAFALAVAINAIFFQAASHSSVAARQAAERAATESERARRERLSLDPALTPAETSQPAPAPVASDARLPSPSPNPTRSAAPSPRQPAAAGPRVVAATATAAPANEDGARRFARLRPDALRFGTGSAADSMPHAPDAEGDPATIAAVQRELSARGYGPLTADGMTGLMTRAAIMAFEYDNNLALTGEATETLLGRILLGAEAGDAQTGDARRVRGPNAEALVRTVQQSLVALGYPIAKVDGRMGEDTARAIANFESTEGVKPKGRISAEVFGRLARAVSAARVTPIR